MLAMRLSKVKLRRLNCISFCNWALFMQFMCVDSLDISVDITYISQEVSVSLLTANRNSHISPYFSLKPTLLSMG